MIIVSKCFTGACCRYDGGTNFDPEIAALVEAGKAVAVCPEELGGLPTPREPAEMNGTFDEIIHKRARVFTKSGRDVTRNFIDGAFLTSEIARAEGATHAVLKARSPSCGVGAVYDGSFSGRLAEHDGVTAALLKKAGLTVESR